MQWDRFDICEAYYLFWLDYPVSSRARQAKQGNGKTIESQLIDMQFRARPSLRRYRDLTENGREIYKALEIKYVPPYEQAFSSY